MFFGKYYLPLPKELAIVAINLRLSLHRAKHLSPTINCTLGLSSTLISFETCTGVSTDSWADASSGGVGVTTEVGHALIGLSRGLLMFIHSSCL